MSKIFIAGVVLFLLLAAAGSSQTTQARTVPWDCSDWAAFAHEDRATSILESLAENRGKTLYCGIDQSDTFAKAETWEAGRGHNERDDTVYWGERGSFRGFIAAQEGWLTDGESGITGQSIAVIFEFPKTKSAGRRTKRISVGTDPEQFPIDAVASCDEVLGLICTTESYGGGAVALNSVATGRKRGRIAATDGGHSNHGWSHVRWVTWDTNKVYYRNNFDQTKGVPTGNAIRDVRPTTAQWTAWAVTAAGQACRARGYRLVAGSARFGPGHDENRGSGMNELGRGLGFFQRQVGTTSYTFPTRQSRTWSAKCIKKGPRR